MLVLLNKGDCFTCLGRKEWFHIFEAKLIPIQPVSTLWGKTGLHSQLSGGSAVWDLNSTSLWISVYDWMLRVSLEKQWS